LKNGWKNASIAMAIVVPIIIGSVGYGGLRVTATGTKEAVEKIEVKVEKNKDDNVIQDLILLKQTIVLERTVKIVEKLEDNLK